MAVTFISPEAIPVGEFSVADAIVRVSRSSYGTVTVKEIGRRTRRIGYLTADGRHEGRSVRATLTAIFQGAAETVVRCDRCRTPLTDETSRRRRLGPECAEAVR